MTRLLALVAAVLLIASPAPAAIVADAAERLRADPVYIDPAAERAIPDAAADELRAQIAASAAGPIFVAILPEAAAAEAGGAPEDVVRALRQQVGRDGTYAVVVGSAFRAASTTHDGVGAAARNAFARHRDDGVAATLLAFVEGVAAVAQEPEAQPAPRDDEGGGFPWTLAALVGGAAALLVAVRRRRRARAADELAPVRAEAHDDLVALAGDVQALETAVEDEPRAREAYTRALEHYERASSAFDRARTAAALEPVARELADGRYEMEVARAILEGRTPPARRDPCFFDPRHGPSVTDVDWAPPGGLPRPVPVCDADLVRLERGEEPAVREIGSGAERRPYWQAGPAFGPYAGGFFGAGVLPALFAGTLLGGMVFSDDAFGAGDSDFGGGDFGGGFGDVGGGDFGGGE